MQNMDYLLGNSALEDLFGRNRLAVFSEKYAQCSGSACQSSSRPCFLMSDFTEHPACQGASKCREGLLT